MTVDHLSPLRSRNVLAVALTLSGLLACSEEPGARLETDASSVVGGGDAAQPEGGSFFDGGFGGNPSGGPGGPAGGGDGGPGAVSGDALPAEVCTVLQKNACLSCHKSPVEGGARMPLSLASHFAAKAQDGTPLGPRLLARIVDSKLPMPPQSTGYDLMPASDVAVLKAWIDGGAKGVTGTECLAGGFVDADAGPSDQKPTWATQPWPAEECEYVMVLGAHGAVGKPVATDPTPYNVPAQLTNYHCFYEKVPWGDKKVQALALRAIIDSPDDKELVHHFVVSGVEPFSQPIAAQRPSGPGDHKDCLNPNGSTLAVWAPGAINPLTYPSDVGVLLPSGDSYLEMQVHYNNNSMLPGKQSKVRYEICATSKLRPQTAGTFWLGYENAFASTLITGKETVERLDNKGNGTAVGRCEAKTKGRILSIMPHMHQKGMHSKFEVIRKDGSVLPIIDSPYNFQDEKSYFRQNLLLDQGDSIRATCKWSANPVYFGFGTDAEMCFFYTLAYPIEVFKANAAEKGIVGGDLACAHALFP